MAVKIRLKRMGKIRAPFYRVVVMDSRSKRDGRAIEEIGKYHPTEEPSLIDIDSERALHWLGVGAQPTEQVKALLTVTGDWARHTGEGDTAGTLRTREPRPDRKALYEAALAAADGGQDSTAPTSRRSGKSEQPKRAQSAEDTPEKPTDDLAATEEATPTKATPEKPTDDPAATEASTDPAATEASTDTEA